MKRSILNLRLDESIKQALEEKCLVENIPISKGARNALDNYLKSDEGINNEEKDIALIQSLGFCEFIFWLLDKLRDPEIWEADSLHEDHMKLILKCGQDNYFTDEIMEEFMKVYHELDELLNDNTHNNDYLKFPQEDNGFDYQKLHEFMHTIRYDNNDNKILYIK